MSLRVMVVDDEAIARRRLRRLVTATRGAEVVGEAGDGRTAVERVGALRPDVLLLDVQMPELDGFGVAAQLPAPRPLVIFVTAFDTYALRAFEIHAVDYLLKPVSHARLADALAHAGRRAATSAAIEQARLSAVLGEVADRTWIDRLPIRSEGQIRLVPVADIDWIEAAGNYAVIHVGRHVHVLRETLTRLESQLDPARFVRIHRSAIVQIDRITMLESASRGDYDVTLRDGTTLSLSRTCRARLERALGRPI